ncbi:MAG: hypothetical protein ACYDGR_18150, partial [Candidatus Dormibacteria bacterium]
MIRETIYTALGSAALAVDFATSVEKQQNWLKKAERRGSKVAQSGRAQLRPLTRNLESTIGEVRHSALSAIGMAEEKAEATQKAARRSVNRARRNAPRVAVSTRTVRVKTGTRKAST